MAEPEEAGHFEGLLLVEEEDQEPDEDSVGQKDKAEGLMAVEQKKAWNRENRQRAIGLTKDRSETKTKDAKEMQKDVKACEAQLCILGRGHLQRDFEGRHRI